MGIVDRLRCRKGVLESRFTFREWIDGERKRVIRPNPFVPASSLRK